MNEKKFVPEHFQKHTVTEWLHIPGHDGRTETLEFRNAKHELEKVEHIGCFVCGTQKQRESHHIVERCYGNGVDFVKVSHHLFYHRDYHGHVKRDFQSPESLVSWFAQHFNGQWFEYYTIDDDGVQHGPFQGLTCDDNALDTLYNQVILCALHHRGEGEGIHGTTGPTFDAIVVAKDGFDVSMGAKEYDKQHKEE